MLQLKHVKIRHRLMVGFALLTLVVTAMNLSGLFSFGQVRDDLAELMQSNIGEVEGATELTLLLKSLQTHLETFLLSSSSNTDQRRARHLQYVDAHLGQLDTVLARIEVATLAGVQLADVDDRGGEQRELIEIDALKEKLKIWQGMVRQVIDINGSGAADSVAAYYQSAVEPLTYEIAAALNYLRKDTIEEIRRELSQIETRNRHHTLFYLVMTMVALATVVGLWFSLTRSISQPLNQLYGAIEQVRNGDLNIRIESSSRDEIGQLARAFAQMIAEMRHTTASVAELNAEINRRIQAEQELRRSQEATTALLNATTDRALIQDADGVILSANEAMIQSLQKDDAAVVGRNYFDFLDEAMADFKHRHLNEVLHSGKPQRFEDKRGNRYFDNVIYPVFDARHRIVQIAIFEHEITHRMMTEHKVREIQKKEAIGTLAGGIAHDFNNLIGIVLGNTELALDVTPDNSQAKLFLSEIRTASLRARDVVRQLLSFSRQTDQAFQAIELTPIVLEAIKLLRASLPRSVAICQHVDQEMESVQADATQIHQVMINLGTNAAHAMRDSGGDLDIRLEMADLDSAAAARFEDIEPGRHVMITVRDTGIGIAPEHMPRIFDPYFTTKSVGEGSGMGLAVVQGIVKAHRGAVRVDSRPGRGTTVTVILPSASRPAAAVADSAEVKVAGIGSERILFVDDEPSMAEISKLWLERMGYRVTAQTSSREALALFTAQPDQFDLVITDMTMPLMTGDVLARHIMAIRSDIPIIMCTGYSEVISAEQAKALGIRSYLEKPVDIQVLSETIRKVLDTPAAAAGPDAAASRTVSLV